jgi:ABC-type phosphate transport system substrate-binding protein
MKFGPASMAIEPTSDNIRSRKFPITRLVWWTLPRNAKADARDFCYWVLSPDGQLVVESVGFEPLPSVDRAAGLKSLHLASGSSVARAGK